MEIQADLCAYLRLGIAVLHADRVDDGDDQLESREEYLIVSVDDRSRVKLERHAGVDGGQSERQIIR